jgi:hypothetical protein
MYLGAILHVHAGILLSQGGEFAFVAFGIAERAGLIPTSISKLLLTTVALSMAITPGLALAANNIASRLDQNMGFKSVLGQDSDSEEMRARVESSDFVVVCGYGRVGKMICDMLDEQLIQYVALDNSPQRAIEARTKGLPVFFGDVNRPEVLKQFDVGDAKACIMTINDMTATNKAVASLRKLYPSLPLIVRARNVQHQRRLESMYDELFARAPVLADDSVLLALPFGGSVLRQIGVSKPEVEAILEDFRRQYLAETDLSLDGDPFEFLDVFNRRKDGGRVAGDEASGDEEGGTSAKGDTKGLIWQIKGIGRAFHENGHMEKPSPVQPVHAVDTTAVVSFDTRELIVDPRTAQDESAADAFVATSAPEPSDDSEMFEDLTTERSGMHILLNDTDVMDDASITDAPVIENSLSVDQNKFPGRSADDYSHE